MKILMKTVKALAGAALFLLSVYMLYNGAVVFSSTSGMVQGSEFGMLITLANQASLIMAWLALYAVWSLIPAPKSEEA